MSALDLLSGLGLGDPGGGGGAPMGGPMEAPPEAPPQQQRGEVESLKALIGMTQEYMEIPGVTEQERNQAIRAQSIFQKLLADNERMEDQTMGTSPALRKALG